MYCGKTGRTSHIVIACILSMAAANLAVAGQVTPQKIAEKMSRIAKQRWTSKNLTIKVVPFQNDSLTQAGRFQAIVLKADSISRKGITVAPIYVKAFDVTLDLYTLYYKNEIKTSKRKNTIINAKISETSLNKLLAMKDMPIKNPKVDFGTGKLTFTGKYQAIFGHNLLMEAKLEVADHRKVNLIPTRVSVNGVPLPAGPVRSLLSKLNPLLDLQDVPLSPTLDSLTITPTSIILKG